MKKQKKIEMHEVDEDIIVELASSVIVDTLINLLVKKKIITEDELNKQLDEDQDNIQRFIRKNPGILAELKEEIIKKRQENEQLDLSYVG